MSEVRRKFDEDFKIGAVRIVRKTRPATGRSVSRRTCQACTRRDGFRRCGRTVSGVVVEHAAAGRSRCPLSSKTSDDNPGKRRAARSRLHVTITGQTSSSERDTPIRPPSPGAGGAARARNQRSCAAGLRVGVTRGGRAGARARGDADGALAAALTGSDAALCRIQWYGAYAARRRCYGAVWRGGWGARCSRGSPTEQGGLSSWPKKRPGCSTTTTSAPSTSSLA